MCGYNILQELSYFAEAVEQEVPRNEVNFLPYKELVLPALVEDALVGIGSVKEGTVIMYVACYG